MNETIQYLVAGALSLLPLDEQHAPGIVKCLQRLTGRPTSKFLGQRKLLELSAKRNHAAVYAGDGRMLCRALNRYLLWTDSSDRGVTPQLALNGIWESWITAALLRSVKPGMICIDVGANHGYYSILMADLAGPSGQVIAFEPNTLLTDLIAASVYTNGFSGRVTLSNHAVSDTDGERVALHYSSGQAMNATMMLSATESSHRIDAESITLDSYCATLARVDLVKIDAEGAEVRIWHGMQKLLDRHPQLTVLLEFNQHRTPQARQFLEALAGRFPTLRRIDSDSGIYAVSIEQVLAGCPHHDQMLYLTRTE